MEATIYASLCINRGASGRRPEFCPPWQGGPQGVWYELMKTPCRKKRGVPLGKGGQMKKLQATIDASL